MTGNEGGGVSFEIGIQNGQSEREKWRFLKQAKHTPYGRGSSPRTKRRHKLEQKRYESSLTTQIEKGKLVQIDAFFVDAEGAVDTGPETDPEDNAENDTLQK